MINDFCNIVQQDIANIGQFIRKPEKSSKEQDEKVAKAAIRMLTILGMALALSSGIGALTTLGVGSLFKLASAGLIFAICHDMFVITANSEKGVVQQLAAVGKGFFADLNDLVTGNKTLNSAPRHPLTDGTILRPFWDIAVAQ
jgi:hypothetical protein